MSNGCEVDFSNRGTVCEIFNFNRTNFHYRRSPAPIEVTSKFWYKSWLPNLVCISKLTRNSITAKFTWQLLEGSLSVGKIEAQSTKY